MKEKNWLVFDDYMKVLGIHLLILIFIILENDTSNRIIVFEIANIVVSILLLKIRNLVIESRLHREAEKQARIEEYKEMIKKQNQD